mmetsp:Transcript_17359/g.51933  ORF Transcript_17359/g.51933 Transcript_17359/m.51933 type:complete len:208 (-) Transcript_17359:604-1227(-)
MCGLWDSILGLTCVRLVAGGGASVTGPEPSLGPHTTDVGDEHKQELDLPLVLLWPDAPVDELGNIKHQVIRISLSAPCSVMDPFWEGELGVGSDVHGVGGLLLCRFLLQPPMRRCVQIVELGKAIVNHLELALVQAAGNRPCHSDGQLVICIMLLGREMLHHVLQPEVTVVEAISALCLVQGRQDLQHEIADVMDVRELLLLKNLAD